MSDEDQDEIAAPGEVAEEAPATAETPEVGPVATSQGELRTLDLAAELVTFSVAQRRLGLRLLSYNTVAESRYGPLLFEPGAFGEVDPQKVRLRMDHEDPPTGLGRSFEDKPDAPYMEFGVSKTSRGDDQLALAVDGVARGASVGIVDGPGKPSFQTRDGRRVQVYGPGSATLLEVSTTWQPTFESAGVMYVLNKDEKGAASMAETQDAPVSEAESYIPRITALIDERDKQLSGKVEKMLGAFEDWKEANRAAFQIPAPPAEPKKPKLYHWTEIALQMMRGKVPSPTLLKELALDDVVTEDNPGLVPEVLVRDFDDLISSERPFLNSIRKIAPPATGMSLLLPILSARAEPGTQAGGEKTEVTTTASKVGTISFPYESIVGGADVAVQMLNRADQSFFDLLTSELAEAYALDCEQKAIAALLAADGTLSGGGSQDGPDDGGQLDPEDLSLGDAWKTSISVYRRAPDTIWMSATAVGKFIDAKRSTDNTPLYSNLAAAFTAGSGVGGVLSGLRPIYVPALDDSEVDVIVGPSRSYVYAEDPARTLQVDVPSKAGRDIALAGGIFYGPRFASAFTTYTVSET